MVRRLFAASASISVTLRPPDLRSGHGFGAIRIFRENHAPAVRKALFVRTLFPWETYDYLVWFKPDLCLLNQGVFVQGSPTRVPVSAYRTLEFNFSTWFVSENPDFR
jgi:hypothetical protein